MKAIGLALIAGVAISVLVAYPIIATIVIVVLALWLGVVLINA